MGKTILVVDDEISFLDIMALLLPRAGYQVLRAAHGEEALRIIYDQAAHIDLILLDDMLPGKSGSEICTQLKADAHVRHIPVLIYSAGPRVRDPELMEQVGADKVVFKPFKTPDLIKIIHSFFPQNASNAPTVEAPIVRLNSLPSALPEEETRTQNAAITATSELAPTKPALPTLDDDTTSNVPA